MTDEMKLQHAREIFRSVCKLFDERGWQYDKDEEKLKINTRTKGEDLPIPFGIYVGVNNQMLTLMSYIPFDTPEDKRLELAIAVSAVNYKLLDGCFDYNVTNGQLFFRLTNSFMESTISEDLLMYMVFLAIKVVDDFNDKFLLLAKGTITLEQFLNALNN